MKIAFALTLLASITMTLFASTTDENQEHHEKNASHNMSARLLLKLALDGWSACATPLTSNSVVAENQVAASSSMATPFAFWNNTGNLNIARDHHTATLLNSGKVLVAGGANDNGPSFNSAELYGPTSETWAFTGSMHVARSAHAAMLLSNGKVLVFGGNDAPTSAELYDPALQTWSLTGSLATSKQGHYTNPAPGVVLLLNGKVLAVGGGSAEIYDPASGTWTVTGSPQLKGNAATLLADGRVLLVAKDPSPSTTRALAELYDPITGLWSMTSSLNPFNDRGYDPALTRLQNGKVLAVGGQGGSPAPAELYDPVSGTWSTAGPIGFSRRQFGHTTTLLNNGQVLLIGGVVVTSSTNAVDLYDPQSTRWNPTEPLNADRTNHTSTLLTNGKVLVAGGKLFPGKAMASSVLYTAYTISGKVSTGTNGLGGVTVTLSGDSSASTTTDANGSYSFFNVKPGGNYIVTPSRANYSFTPASSSFSNLSNDQTSANFTAELAKYAISGRVSVGANGLSSVTVSLSGGQSATATTDSNGNYSFTNLQATGNYTVTPSRANYIFSPQSRTFTNLGTNENSADFVAEQLFKISGHIKTTNNEALSNVIVLLSGTTSSTAVSDSNGNFSFDGLTQDGDYVITPAKTNYTFTPALRTFVDISSDQTADFTASTLELLLEEGTSNRVVAMDSVLFLKDPFLPITPDNLMNTASDKNTHVVVFVTNLLLLPGDTSSNVVVNASDINNVSYLIPAKDVRLVPALPFTQVIFRLPDGLPSGDLTISVTYRGQSSNSGVMRIR